MVLPAPAPDAAPLDAPWLDRLSRILRLSAGGVIVRIDGARDERLGELVRRLVSERAETEVLLEAPALASAPEGSVVVLRLRAEDRTWLNLARPVVAQRALRLILWSDAAATAALVHGAIDFFDWISHRIECPAGPPSWAARALRRAMGMRAPAAAWWGTGFEEAFQVACPGRRLVPISGALPYSDLVEALRPEPRTWAAVREVDGEDRLQRVRWASAEARRWGGTVLVNPLERAEVPGVDVRTMGLDEAAARLRAAGAGRPARLAALVNLSERGVETVRGWLASGVGEAEIEGRVSADGEVRAGGVNGAVGRLDQWPRRLAEYSERVKAAMEVGDYGVARRWTAGWAEVEPERAEVWIAQAELKLWADDLHVAAEMIERARARLGERQSGRADIDLMVVEAGWQYARGRIRETLDASESGIQAARRRGLQPPGALRWLKILALMGLGRETKAARVLEDWTQRATRSVEPAADHILRKRARAAMLHRAKNPTAAREILCNALEELPARHALRWSAEMQLALVDAELGRGDAAIEALDRTLTALERVEAPTHQVLWTQGRTLLQRGQLKEAEAKLRRSVTTGGVSLNAVQARLGLAMCLFEQGRLDEARVVAESARKAGCPALLPNVLALEGMISASAGQPEAAADLLSAALVERDRFHGEREDDVDALLGALAAALVQAGKPHAAESPVRRKLRIAERRRDLLGQADATRFLAMVQRAQGFPQAAHTQRLAEDLQRRADAAGLRRQEPFSPVSIVSPF